MYRDTLNLCLIVLKGFANILYCNHNFTLGDPKVAEKVEIQYVQFKK